MAKAAGTVRLVSYNVENLFDNHDDPTLSGDQEDIDDAKPPEELKALAATLRALDADIVALQEIESLAALTEFRDAHISDLGYIHVVSIDSGDSRGIENAVLSRFPLSDPQVWPNLPLGGTHPELWGNQPNYHAGEPITFRRSPLRVSVTIPAPTPAQPVSPVNPAFEPGKPYELTLFVVHFKSGFHGGYWREREAVKTVELIADFVSTRPDANYVVVGDLNSTPDEAPCRALLDAGMIDAFSPLRAPNPLVTHASERSIDYVLVSPTMSREYRQDAVFVHPTPWRAPDADWRTTPAPPGYVSDHRPLVIDIVPVDR